MFAAFLRELRPRHYSNSVSAKTHIKRGLHKNCGDYFTNVSSFGAVLLVHTKTYRFPSNTWSMVASRLFAELYLVLVSTIERQKTQKSFNVFRHQDKRTASIDLVDFLKMSHVVEQHGGLHHSVHRASRCFENVAHVCQTLRKTTIKIKSQLKHRDIPYGTELQHKILDESRNITSKANFIIYVIFQTQE